VSTTLGTTTSFDR